MENYTRRLPVYLLIDTSGSMMGEPIEAVKQGVKVLLSELKSDPQTIETAYLSVITFDSHARQAVPLTELMRFTEPELNAGGATALGEALMVLMDCIKKEVKNTSADRKGDWRPLVFILTDGSPTDIAVFNEAVERIKTANIGSIVACAAGSKTKTEPLKRITDNVLIMNTISTGDLSNFFTWVSGSVKMSSRSIDAKIGKNFDVPPPQGFIVVH